MAEQQTVQASQSRASALPALSSIVSVQPFYEHLQRLGWRDLRDYLEIAGTLGFLVLIAQEFELVGAGFFHYVMQIAFFGFLIHYVLPTSYRLPFFLALSLACFARVLGLQSCVQLTIVATVLVGICHLPAGIWTRSVLLLSAGVALAAMRVEFIPSWLPRATWPILGSMFMFRIIVYLYDVHVNKEPFHFCRSFSYFFLLPNVVFPLFPVVDYRTFHRTYYDQPADVIARKGLLWIYRGIVHLLLYRVVNQYLTLAPDEIHGAGQLTRYMVANYLLYLKVSGQFHLSVGLLHMYGFNLPETHHLYYAASSFTDFWRRINIYWKDFMQKTVFYPAYFRLRRFGTDAALVASTVIVFLVTWLAHSYQWFWLTGTILFSDSDMLFWGILALLVVINSLYETKYGRRRRLGKKAVGFRERLTGGLKTAAVFSTICMLWSLWTAPTLGDWLDIWRLAGVSFF